MPSTIQRPALYVRITSMLEPGTFWIPLAVATATGKNVR